MSLNLMYITNDPEMAKIAENAGVNWIFIDLEINGKEKRQGHLDTVISKHSIDDVKTMKSMLAKSKLLVRVNPIYYNSEEEINAVIQNGADIVMLPFFKTSKEVEKFIEIVNHRAKTCLLLETPEAVESLDEILKVNGIDMVHIGLNDLHLGYRMNFMFEPLANGMVENIGKKIKEKGIKFGFGGIAKLGTGTLPAENILTEHYRLDSSMVILSRAFCDIKKVNSLEEVEDSFQNGVLSIRRFEKSLENKDTLFFEKNVEMVKTKINEIVEKLRGE